MAKRIFLYILALAMMLPATSLAQRLTHRVRMGVVLPLKEKSSRGAKMIEFYQGLLMAVDSVKHQGCSVDVTAVHSGFLAADMDSLLATSTLSGCDVIFGPLDTSQLPALAGYCDTHGIRLVVPFSSLATQVPSHPRHYLVNAPRHMVQRQAAWFVQTMFPQENFVIVESGEKNDEGSSLVEFVRSAVDGLGAVVRQISVNASVEEFAAVLTEGNQNVLLLDSSTMPALNALLAKLHQLAPAYPGCRFTLFGFPAWQSYASQLQNDFFQFNTYIYTPFYRDGGDMGVQAVEQQFQQHFSRPMQPTYPRYGLLGFDLGYYFLSGLGMYGDQLEANLSAVPVRPLQSTLSFEQQSPADGYINRFVQLVHYTNAQSIEILYRTNE